MFQVGKKEEELFEALRHLKYNKHEVVLFHTYDYKTEVNFDFDSGTLSEVQKAAAVIGAPDMCLEDKDVGSSVIKVTDKKNTTANDFAIEVDVDKTEKSVPYKFWFKVENLKVIPSTYRVQVSSKSISTFVNEKLGVQYWIALEPESTYNA